MKLIKNAAIALALLFVGMVLGMHVLMLQDKLEAFAGDVDNAKTQMFLGGEK